MIVLRFRQVLPYISLLTKNHNAGLLSAEACGCSTSRQIPCCSQNLKGDRHVQRNRPLVATITQTNPYHNSHLISVKTISTRRCHLTHWGPVTQICVFALQFWKRDDANLCFNTRLVFTHLITQYMERFFYWSSVPGCLKKHDFTLN
jgi:hypothetical protein